ncbi:MAG: glycosyltransferase, partial [Dermatophilaceae bacterium]
WAYLLAGHGGFWLTRPRLPVDPPQPARWPRVAVVVPARDEAAVLPQTLPTLLRQDYPGELAVWLVDDASTDGTAEVAPAHAHENQGRVVVTVLHAPPPAHGWTGKLSALRRKFVGGQAASWVVSASA